MELGYWLVGMGVALLALVWFIVCLLVLLIRSGRL